MRRKKTYVGIQNDATGGMNPIGNIIRDAWVFEIIPETETCEGWTIERIGTLDDQVKKAWEPYGHVVSKLPPDLRTRHERIYRQAIEAAQHKDWNPELDESKEV